MKHVAPAPKGSSDSSNKATADKPLHWLYRPENIPKLWGIQALVLVLALVPEFFIHHHAHFERQGIHVDASWGFYAWFGFLACAAMVIAAKLLGFLLKRKDSYYHE